MAVNRPFTTYSYRDAYFRISSPFPETVKGRIRKDRLALEEYIRSRPDFATSLKPLDKNYDAPLKEGETAVLHTPAPTVPPKQIAAPPEIALRMFQASEATGLGPMAAVAGTVAERACMAALDKGAAYTIVENGGDIFCASDRPVYLGLYPGEHALKGKLAFRLDPEYLPVAACSSSGLMGHSYSAGRCDLATVFAPDASLADAAATLACNLISEPKDIEPVLNRIMAIKGIRGILIVKSGQVGVAGKLPEMVRNKDLSADAKITRHPESGARVLEA